METTIIHSHLIPHEKAAEFIAGGMATFTFKSVKTGNRFTFKARTYNKYMINIDIMRGNDNTTDFSHMCTVTFIEGKYKIKPVGRFNSLTPCYVAFEYVFTRLLIRMQIENLEIWSSGRCCRCGRKLTVPESIESGIGPECAGKESIMNFN